MGRPEYTNQMATAKNQVIKYARDIGKLGWKGLSLVEAIYCYAANNNLIVEGKPKDWLLAQYLQNGFIYRYKKYVKKKTTLRLTGLNEKDKKLQARYDSLRIAHNIS